jgi:hypothetical protein
LIRRWASRSGGLVVTQGGNTQQMKFEKETEKLRDSPSSQRDPNYVWSCEQLTLPEIFPSNHVNT